MGRAYSLEIPYPIYDTDVQIKGDKGTQADVNQALTLAQANQLQNLEQAQGTKSRGYWTHHGGPLPPDGAPGWNMFYMRDAEGERTQDFGNAKSVLVHAMGSQITDLTGNVVLGAAEVGDELLIQDMEDVDGGAYVITSVATVEPEGEDYTGSYATLGVEPLGEFTRGTVGPSEVCVIKLKKSSAVPVVEGEYLPLSGGTMAGALYVTRPGSTAAGVYVFSVKAEGLEDGKQVAFRVTADGSVKAGHDTSHAFRATSANDVVTKAYTDDHTLQPDKANSITTGFRIKCNNQTFFSASNGELGLYHLKEPTDVTHAATMGYVDRKVAEGGGGSLGFTKQYDGNKFCKPGTTDTVLSEGDVMFLSNGTSTTTFTAVTHVALPESEYDWDKFTGIGTIKVKNGATVCGYLQVISATNNPGHNWLVKVKVLDVESNDLDPESGHPCYFNGMFIE